MKNLAIVGGFAAGKTTLSEGLVQQGYVRISFARYLKEIAQTVYGGGRPIEKTYGYFVTDPNGDDRIVSGRQLLQELGQSVKALDRDFWIKSLLADVAGGFYGPGPYVTDDCRFPYEAEAMRTELGMTIIKLDTPIETRIHRYEKLYGRKPTTSELVHPSEIELVNIKPDYVVDGTLSAGEILQEVYGIANER